MNGDSLLYVRVFILRVKYIIYTKNKNCYLRPLLEKATWANIFLALNALLVELNEK